MSFFQDMVNHKLRQLSPAQLKDIGRQYGITISDHEAALVSQKLQASHINVFNDFERQQLLQELTQIVSPAVVSQVEYLFQQFVR